jgi:hypothetical protein
MCYRKLNTSPATLDEKDVLKKPLVLPKVKKIDLHFPLGLEVTARNLKGVTIKDALDAIYKQFKKKVYIHLLSHILSHSLSHTLVCDLLSFWLLSLPDTALSPDLILPIPSILTSSSRPTMS